MKPIRVLNLFTIMNRGGAETMVMNYYRKIDRSKVQFDFLVHRKERGAYDDEIEAMGGRIYRMCPIYPQNFWKYKLMLRDFFKQHQEYNIIHSHMSELGYFALREAKKQKIPIRICHAHNAPNGIDAKMIIREYFKRSMMSSLTHMFICGEDAGNWLYGEKNKEKFIMLNNAIDTKKFIYSPVIAEKVKKDLGIKGKFVIGHVGRFNKQKNHDFIIDIFAEFQKINPDSVLLLVGDGELRSGIEEKVKAMNLQDSVLLTGVRSDVSDLMQAMDVFLFPSLFEGLPLTMVEAQASGLMCFISDKVPSQCIITDVVKVLSLDSTADIWAATILEETRQFNKRNMVSKIVEVGFDIEENSKWLENFYLQMFKESSKEKYYI